MPERSPVHVNGEADSWRVNVRDSDFAYTVGFGRTWARVEVRRAIEQEQVPRQ